MWAPLPVHHSANSTGSPIDWRAWSPGSDVSLAEGRKGRLLRWACIYPARRGKRLWLSHGMRTKKLDIRSRPGNRCSLLGRVRYRVEDGANVCDSCTSRLYCLMRNVRRFTVQTSNRTCPFKVAAGCVVSHGTSPLTPGGLRSRCRHLIRPVESVSFRHFKPDTDVRNPQKPQPTYEHERVNCIPPARDNRSHPPNPPLPVLCQSTLSLGKSRCIFQRLSPSTTTRISSRGYQLRQQQRRSAIYAIHRRSVPRDFESRPFASSLTFPLSRRIFLPEPSVPTSLGPLSTPCHPHFRLGTGVFGTPFPSVLFFLLARPPA